MAKQHSKLRLIPVRDIPGKALEETARKRILLGAAAHRSTFNLLRRDVVDRANYVPGLRERTVLSGLPGQPEVRQVNLLARLITSSEKNVRWLDITMHQPTRVRCVQRGRNQLKNGNRALRRQPPLLSKKSM